MSKTAKGVFYPKNPEKYIGNKSKEIQYRSSWEYTLQQVLDSNAAVLAWSSECIRINYWNPLSRKHSIYIPDFFVIYQDKNGNKNAEIIEIKPKKEDPRYQGRVSARDKLAQAVNAAKWQAAQAYCRSKGYTFRVMTEDDLFSKPTRRK